MHLMQAVMLSTVWATKSTSCQSEGQKVAELRKQEKPISMANTTATATLGNTFLIQVLFHTAAGLYE